MSDFGIRASVSGSDVKSALSKKYAWTSKYPNPKVQLGQEPAHFDYEEYTFTSRPGDGRHHLITVPHGYGYTPANFAQISFDQSTFYLLPLVYAQAFDSNPLDGVDDGFSVWYEAYADDTNFYVDYNVNNSSYAPNPNGDTIYIKYTIFAETGMD